RFSRDWSSDVCSSDLARRAGAPSQRAVAWLVPGPGGSPGAGSAGRAQHRLLAVVPGRGLATAGRAGAGPATMVAGRGTGAVGGRSEGRRVGRGGRGWG